MHEKINKEHFVSSLILDLGNHKLNKLGGGLSLPSWHHLVSNDKNTVHTTGNSVMKRVIFERDLTDEDLEDRIVEWPLKITN